MNSLLKINVLILILFFNFSAFSQTVEDGWQGIKPLKTKKSRVDKILGKPEMDNNGYQRYSTNEALVQMNFSTFPCKVNQYKRGRYRIAENVVLDYIVNLDKKIKLSELKYKKLKYTKDRSGDLKTTSAYINEDDGVLIEVYIDEDETEYVSTIYYKPNKRDAELLLCKGNS